MLDKEKIFFLPGMLVTLKLDLPNKPIMLVVKKETLVFKRTDSKEPILKGIRCRWFTKDGLLQEATFNTKDLIKV